MKLAAWLLLLPLGASAQEKVIDVRGSRSPGGDAFDTLWTAYRKADGANDKDASGKVLREIRRVRMERNIPGLEVVGLALVDTGEKRFEKGDVDRAAEDFRNATLVDPHLPDGYFGLAQTELHHGALGIVTAFKDLLAGVGARLGTYWGEYFLLTLVIPSGLLGAFAATTTTSLALLLRDGPLLLHDLEESVALFWGRGTALAIFGVILLLPTATFQGYGWLPLWWCIVLYVYLALGDRLVVAFVLIGSLTIPLSVQTLKAKNEAVQNPTFRAGMTAIEGAADQRTIDELDKAVNQHPNDEDLPYLLALAYKKAGRYEDAAEVYRQLIAKQKENAVAFNNLANIEFARGEYQAAIALYKQGVETNPPPERAATFNYNLNFAYLHRFEPEPARQARAEAERLAGSRVRTYDNLWSLDDWNAVVDLGPSRDYLWAKFAGGKPNPLETGGRFLAALGVAAIVVFVMSKWRGSRAFTMRCLKCGTPFCKKCHLGTVVGGLCTQCHHLFVVRDGVSGPARNSKLLEVQEEDARRERTFRLLSLISPGAGHVYAHRTVSGFVLALAWYTVLALCVLTGRVLPLTEAPPVLAGNWGVYLGGILLVILYVIANRARPDFEVSIPGPRGPRR